MQLYSCGEENWRGALEHLPRSYWDRGGGRLSCNHLVVPSSQCLLAGFYTTPCPPVQPQEQQLEVWWKEFTGFRVRSLYRYIIYIKFQLADFYGQRTGFKVIRHQTLSVSSRAVTQKKPHDCTLVSDFWQMSNISIFRRLTFIFHLPQNTVCFNYEWGLWGAEEWRWCCWTFIARVHLRCLYSKQPLVYINFRYSEKLHTHSQWTWWLMTRESHVQLNYFLVAYFAAAIHSRTH